MTSERARKLLALQVKPGSGYNRNAARVILTEVNAKHGQQVLDRLITELELEKHFGL